jgi:2-polyprenyl-3-methyl-5-hydroxy-6-metoxy-1,4-benzoquinol methylase
MIEVNECPICGSSSFKKTMSVKDNSISKESFTIKTCSSCGLRITSPRPIDSELGKYYESEDYVSHSDTNKGFINTIYQMVKSYTLKKKETLLSSFNTNKILLDIGCGTGDFLHYCKTKNWKVSGLEPDENARKKGHEKGLLDIKNSDQLFSLNEKFGVITMWHVLEHVSELNKYFNKLHDLIDDNGRLIIAVPNPDSADAKKYKEMWAAYDVPRHLFHFSKSNIIDLATKHGFIVEKIKPMLFDSFYVSMLSEKYKKGSFLNAMINGLRSNIKGSQTINHSSLIYILSKKG